MNAPTFKQQMDDLKAEFLNAEDLGCSLFMGDLHGMVHSYINELGR